MYSLAKRILKNRRLMTLFAVTIIWLSITTAFAGSAKTQSCFYGMERWWFTDATKTEECGYTNSCTGESWGHTSPYFSGHAMVCWCD